MLVGCCASMIAPNIDPIGIESIEVLAELGYDYIELSLSHFCALPEDAFCLVAQRIRDSGLSCLACNNFFPPRLRLTGSEASMRPNLEYADTAIQRASAIGAKTIVFGSSGAKNVPKGFPMNVAWLQISELLRNLGPIAKANGVVIAIEPISRPESNVVLKASEGLQLMREVNHPNIQLLIDYYHMATEHEDDSIVTVANKSIRHVHLATSSDRRFPNCIDQGIDSFLRKLHTTGYDAGISIEALTDLENFRQEAAASLLCLKTWVTQNVF